MTTTSANTLRAGVLNRKSTEQKDLRSVKQQNSENLKVCAANGWIVTPETTYDLDGKSASRFGGNNPIETVLAKPLADIRDRKIDVLVIWETSRASRDMAAFGLLLNACEEAGVLLCSGGRIYDPSESTDRMTLGIDALSAEREANDTRKRIMRDLRHAAEQGRPHGRKLYGYRRVYDDSKTPPKLIGQVPDEAQAKVVREIVEDFLATGRTNWITRKLNDRGEPSPAGAKWNLSQIKRILTKPSYAGLRQYQGQVIGKAGWKALISAEERERILAMLDADPIRAKGGVRSSDGTAKYLLTGIARCGVPECGDRLYRSYDRMTREIYWCRGTINPKYRKGHLVRDKGKLDQLITDLVLAWLAQPDVLDNLDPGPDPVAAEVRTEIADLQHRLDEAANEYLAGNLSASMLAKIESSLLAKIDNARKRIRASVAIPSSVYDLAAADDIAAAWNNSDMATRRATISALMDIKVMPSSAPRGSSRFMPDDIVVTWRY